MISRNCAQRGFWNTEPQAILRQSAGLFPLVSANTCLHLCEGGCRAPPWAQPTPSLGTMLPPSPVGRSCAKTWGEAPPPLQRCCGCSCGCRYGYSHGHRWVSPVLSVSVVFMWRLLALLGLYLCEVTLNFSGSANIVHHLGRFRVVVSFQLN